MKLLYFVSGFNFTRKGSEDLLTICAARTTGNKERLSHISFKTKSHLKNVSYHNDIHIDLKEID